MSYNPHEYKHLFKKGLFDYPDKKFNNWGESQKLFALNEEPLKYEEKNLAPGLVMKRGHIKIANGFSNYVIFEIDTKVRKVETHYEPRSTYPISVFNKIAGVKALSNLGYYYLTTHEKLDKVKPPRIRVCNLAVYRGKIINLPIVDRSAFLSFKDKKFYLGLIRAEGLVEIGGQVSQWAGSKTGHPREVTVYNNSNIVVTAFKHPIIGPFRTPNKTFITPRGGHKLLVCTVKYGKVTIAGIKKSKTLINSCDLVLEVRKGLEAKIAEPVNFITLDNFKLHDAEFGVSIGPVLRRAQQERIKQVTKEGLDNDPFLSNAPHREGISLARGCLVDLGGGKLAAVTIDGIPQAGDIYPGVTPEQLSEFVCSVYPEHKIAVCTDPSNTVKAIYLNGKKTYIFGNNHYLAYRRLKSGELKFWPDGMRGRKLHTMFVIK